MSVAKSGSLASVVFRISSAALEILLRLKKSSRFSQNTYYLSISLVQFARLPEFQYSGVKLFPHSNEVADNFEARKHRDYICGTNTAIAAVPKYAQNVHGI